MTRSMWWRLAQILLQDFKQPSLYILAAQSVRGLPVPREPKRGDGAVGGARVPMGTPRGGINVPTSRGKAPRAPKARRSASQRSTGHQAVNRSGAPPVRPAFALSNFGTASRKRSLIGQDASRISEVLGTWIGIHSQVRERRLAGFVPRTQRSAPRFRSNIVFVMHGLDPRIHRSSQGRFRKKW
jgi:hypothetical protein